MAVRFRPHPSNLVGAISIFPEKLPRQSLPWDEANESQRGKIAEQLVDIDIQPKMLSFNQIGRLHLVKYGGDGG